VEKVGNSNEPLKSAAGLGRKKFGKKEPPGRNEKKTKNYRAVYREDAAKNVGKKHLRHRRGGVVFWGGGFCVGGVSGGRSQCGGPPRRCPKNTPTHRGAPNCAVSEEAGEARHAAHSSETTS